MHLCQRVIQFSYAFWNSVSCVAKIAPFSFYCVSATKRVPWRITDSHIKLIWGLLKICIIFSQKCLVRLSFYCFSGTKRVSRKITDKFGERSSHIRLIWSLLDRISIIFWYKFSYPMPMHRTHYIKPYWLTSVKNLPEVVLGENLVHKLSGIA